jgi:uncharacterized repeat protein (TIGR01451 family)
MNLATLALIAPLAAGLNPSAAGPGCPPGGCLPGAGAGPLVRVPLPPAPLLAVRLTAPAGVRVTVSPGSPLSAMFPAPATLGFRPGYVYRLELAGLPGRPDAVLYPEVEVRGSLVPRPGMNYMDYPAPVAFTPDDLERAANGALITKVIFLEDPEKAAPVRTTVDAPLELPAPTEPDAFQQATDNGRLVAIVRLGNRVPPADELARRAVAGTVLLPGDARLAAPAGPPQIGWCGVPLYDPILGPKLPGEECIQDGGDTGPRLGIGPGGRLGGLDPTDVAAEYTRRGVRRVTTSNQVCVCAPRFAVRRVDVALGGLQITMRAEAGVQRFRAGSVLERLRTDSLAGRVKPAGTDTTVRPMAQNGRIEAFVALGVVGPAKAYANARGVRVVVQSVEPEEANNTGGFCVTKEVTPKAGVRVGDEVTFTLRFQNSTPDALADVVLSDSLSPRLEYVPGSAESDRPTNVSTEPNEAGSVIVRFEVPGGLQPGQGGVVRFKARVR